MINSALLLLGMLGGAGLGGFCGISKRSGGGSFVGSVDGVSGVTLGVSSLGIDNLGELRFV